MSAPSTDPRARRAEALLLITAVLWGGAFVAQRLAMQHLGPMAFNGIRFALGAIVLLPFALRPSPPRLASGLTRRRAFAISAGAGVLVFGGASFQQMGVVYTTAGKAGFITGLYVILVPILGLALRHRPGLGVWCGAVMATVGMYLLSATEQMTIQHGDFLVLCGSFLWASHVLLLGWIAPRMSPYRLAAGQFAMCSVLSCAAALITEQTTLSAVFAAAGPILYGGVISVGIAYTLQVVGQRDAPPAPAAIILCLESVFAALFGWLLLSETLGIRGITGCVLMFLGMIAAQLWPGEVVPSRAPADPVARVEH